MLAYNASLFDDYKSFAAKNKLQTPDSLLYNGHTYYCIDLETTGFDPYKDEITQVAIATIENNKLASIWTSYHWADNYKATEDLTKIGYDQIKDKSKFRDDIVAKEHIRNILNSCYNQGYAMMSQYAPFEFTWLSENLGLSFDGINVYDTCFAEIVLNDGLVQENGKRLSAGMTNTMERYGITTDAQLHNAVNDVKMMYEIYLKQDARFKNK